MLKDKKDKAVLNVFIKIVNESNHNPNNLRVDNFTINLCKNG